MLASPVLSQDLRWGDWCLTVPPKGALGADFWIVLDDKYTYPIKPGCTAQGDPTICIIQLPKELVGIVLRWQPPHTLAIHARDPYNKVDLVPIIIPIQAAGTFYFESKIPLMKDGKVVIRDQKVEIGIFDNQYGAIKNELLDGYLYLNGWCAR